MKKEVKRELSLSNCNIRKLIDASRGIIAHLYILTNVLEDSYKILLECNKADAAIDLQKGEKRILYMNNYSIAYAEVYEILNKLNRKEYDKIPKDILEVISENRDKNYKYVIQGDLANQEMLPETKAILYNFYRDYWATEEKRKIIINNQRKERWKLEEEKRKQFNKKNIFTTKDSEVSISVELIENKKQSILKRIINFMKNLFINKNG